MTLDKCSCAAPVGIKSKKRCTEITRDVEEFCFRNMLGNFRHYMKFPIGQKKEKLPLFLRHKDGTEEIIEVDIQNHFGMMAVPKFEAPGILSNRKVNGTVGVWAYTPNPDAVKSFPEDTRVGRSEFHAHTYARMLAKIAHSWAVADNGLDVFETLFLPDFILGRDLILPADYYVGCLQTDEPPEDVLHRVSTDMLTLPDGRQFLSVNIRLFARFGAPRYHVVVGTLKPEA